MEKVWLPNSWVILSLMYLKRAKYVHYCDTFGCGLQDMCFKTFHTYKMTSRAFVFVFVFASNHRPYLEHGWLRKCVSGHFTRIRRLVIAVITLPPPAIGWSPPHILNFILWRFSPFWSHFLSFSSLDSKPSSDHLSLELGFQSSCTSDHRSHLIIDNQNQDSKARTYPIN